MEFVGLVVIVVGIGVLTYITVRMHRPLAIERGLTPFYTTTLAGHFDSLYSGYPFVRLTLYHDFLVIRSPWCTAVLRYDEIDAFEIGRHLLMRGVFIRHHNPDVPKRVIVGSPFPFGATDLKRMLEVVSRIGESKRP